MIDSGTAQGIITILFMFAFMGLLFMVFSPSKKALYEERGRIPLEESKTIKNASDSDKQ